MNYKKIIAIAILVCLIPFYTFATDNLLNAAEPICYGEEVFIERIKQHSNGKEPVGLVLSGGSARALAHIGVLKYLEEKNLVPDFIISNSMGSIVGVLYAAGLSPDQITNILEKADLGKLFDVSLPVNSGVLNVDYAIAMVKSILGYELNVEELNIPMMILAEDFVTKQQVRICSGDVYTALQASFAMPFFMSPVEYDDHLLTDGGVVNLTPISVAYDYGKTNIIATTFYEAKNANYHNPITSIMGAMDIAKRRFGVTDILSCPDALWIRCNVEDMSFMNFDDMSEMVKKGYDSCEQYEKQIVELAKQSRKVDSEMIALRDKYQQSTQAFFESYNKLGYIRLDKTAKYFNLPHKTYSRPENNLKSDMTLGLGYIITNGVFAVNPNAGVAFNIESGNTFIKPALNLMTNLYLSDSIKIEAEGSFTTLKDWNAFENLSYKFGNFTVGESFEINHNLDSVLSAYIIHEQNNLNLELALELWNKKPVVYTKGEYKKLLENAPFKISLTADAAIVPSEIKTSSVGAEAEFCWNYRGEKLTIAEILLISDLNAGLYAKAGYSFTDGADFTLGLTSDLNIKLIGLVGIPSSFRCGYNFTKHSVDYRVRFDF